MKDFMTAEQRKKLFGYDAKPSLIERFLVRASIVVLLIVILSALR